MLSFQSCVSCSFARFRHKLSFDKGFFLLPFFICQRARREQQSTLGEEEKFSAVEETTANGEKKGKRKSKKGAGGGRAGKVEYLMCFINIYMIVIFRRSRKTGEKPTQKQNMSLMKNSPFLCKHYYLFNNLTPFLSPPPPPKSWCRST